MLFKKEFIELILSHEKTQTRRLSKRRPVKPYNYFWAQTALFDAESRFARCQAIRVEEWDGVFISEEDAVKEGFKSSAEFWDIWYEINSDERINDPDRTHYVIDFRVVPKEDWHMTSNKIGMFTPRGFRMKCDVSPTIDSQRVIG